MDDVVFIEDQKGFDNLAEKNDDFCLGNELSISDERLKIALIAVFLEYVDIFGTHAIGNQFDDMWAVLFG